MKTAFRNTVAALLERQARRHIEGHRIRVVVVAGSVGKTSTHLAIATMLGQKYRVQPVNNPGYNTEIGLPLAVFDLAVPRQLFDPFAWAARLIQTELIIHRPYPYNLLVLEVGIDHVGEFDRYLRYLSPEVGVVTAVTPEHMEGFPGGMDQVAAEELKLAAASKQFLANHDDIAAPYRHKYIDHHPGHHYYGLGREVEYGITVTASDPVAGTVATISKDGHAVVKGTQINLYGDHSAKIAAAAYAVGDLLELTPHELEAGLAKIHPVSGRMNPLPGANGSTIIDDSYNSSPEAALAALAALAAAPTTGRRFAILGSMNELGPDSQRYHEQVGEAATGVDHLVTVGADAGHYLGPAAVRAGLDPTRCHAADSPYAAGEYLRLLLQPGDVVLVKGSQGGVFTEEAVKLLLESPTDAARLVRQSPAWLARKAKLNQ